MAFIAAHDDVKVNRRERKLKSGSAWRTEFIPCPDGNTTDPNAFLAERSYNGGIPTHFHDVDQFQVIVSGNGTLGRHQLAHQMVHFARAHTPYGPIVPTEEGLGFLTLRARRATGQFVVPGKLDMLKAVPDRRPWQVSENAEFGSAGDVAVHAFSTIRNDEGLAAYTMRLKPHATTPAPDPSAGAGQYLIVTKGSLTHEGKDHGAITIIFVKPDEQPFHLVAGAQGMEVLALNFPREHAQGAPAFSAKPGSRVWQCLLCAFTYNEAQGMPEEGVAPGTRWEDVPESWSCPDCSATKSDFEMVVVG